MERPGVAEQVPYIRFNRNTVIPELSRQLNSAEMCAVILVSCSSVAESIAYQSGGAFAKTVMKGDLVNIANNINSLITADVWHTSRLHVVLETAIRAINLINVTNLFKIKVLQSNKCSNCKDLVAETIETNIYRMLFNSRYQHGAELGDCFQYDDEKILRTRCNECRAVKRYRSRQLLMAGEIVMLSLRSPKRIPSNFELNHGELVYIAILLIKVHSSTGAAPDKFTYEVAGRGPFMTCNHEGEVVVVYHLQ